MTQETDLTGFKNLLGLEKPYFNNKTTLISYGYSKKGERFSELKEYFPVVEFRGRFFH
jgi:hypothetical protein